MSASHFKLPAGNPCYFCDVLATKNPLGLITESAETITMVNPREHQQGQLLVVTKRHAPTLLDLGEEEASDVFLAAKKAGLALAKAYEVDGILVYQNNGVASGQEVPHFHLHVVPQRFSSSRWGNEPPHVADALGREFKVHEPTWLSEDAIAQVASHLKEHW
jgi:histidine triad (HIT) family protein